VSLDGLTWFCIVVSSYLIGSISPAYLATRLLTGQDIRKLGDRNSGAANVFRNVSQWAGVVVGIADVAKGAAAVLLARGVADSTALEMVAGVVVLAGHNWPVHLGLRGGRGAAASVGVLMAMLPLLTVPVAAVTLLILFLTRKSTLALGFFLIAVPILSWPVGYDYPKVIYSVAVPVLVGLTHYFTVRGHTVGDSPEPEQPDERALPQG
jgi:glycerol-3-phosphate acyltransferase PlsY